MTEFTEASVVRLVGKLTEEFEHDHTCGDKKMYKGFLSIERTSGTEDKIPVIINQDLFDKFQQDSIFIKNRDEIILQIEGQISSYKFQEGEKNRLLVYIKGENIEIVSKKTAHINSIMVSGRICKPVIYRTTPGIKDENGEFIKEPSNIADILLKCNGKSIPCIAWNKKALYASNFKVGDKISLVGRFQSREYYKEINEALVTKMAYELSIGNFYDVAKGDSMLE